MKPFRIFRPLALLLLLFLYTQLAGQCPPGSVYFYNQNQVDAFLANYPNCEEINGSLIISFQSSPEISDLTPFRNIKRVKGDLQAAELNSLTNLNGLQQIEYVQKSLRLNLMPLVTSISEFKNLKEVGEFILILNMANLVRVDSFESLTSIGKSLNITRSPKLQTIAGFQNLETVNSLTFELNPELIQLPEFTSLKHVGLSIKIVDSPKLKGRIIFPKLKGSISNLNIELMTSQPLAFSGFHLLDSIRTDVVIDLPNGQFHNAFQNLKYIGGNAEISTNNSYFDFAGELNHVMGYLSITNCPHLKSLGNFNDQLNVDDYIALWNNPVLNVCNVPFICRSKEAGHQISIVGGINPCSSINTIDCTVDGISGTFYYDQNQNGTRDLNEEGVSNMQATVNQIGAILLSNQDGQYFFNAEEGSDYTVMAAVPLGWHLTSNPSYSITFSPNDPLHGAYDFGVHADMDTSSYAIRLFGSEVRCSRYATLHVAVENKGTHPAEGHMNLQYEPEMTYAFSVPPADSVDTLNHQLLWDIALLGVAEDQKITVCFNTPGTLSNADSVHFQLNAEIGDAVYNERYASAFVCGDVSAESKFVFPNDGSTDHLISKDQELVYSVNFQNQHKGELRTVVIYDTLSPFLDISTLKILDANFPVATKVEGNTIQFTFDQLFLLDTIYSENQNNVFVTYSIHPLPNVANGAIISNIAYIDFNQDPRMITNTVINTIEGETAVKDLLEGGPIHIYPNPNSGSFVLNLTELPDHHPYDIRIMNLHGQVMDQRVITDQHTHLLFNKEALHPGLYIVTAVDLNTQSRSITKLVIL